MYPAYMLCAAPALADAPIVCAVSLLVTSAIQPIKPLYNSLDTSLVLHNSITGSIECDLIPDKYNY